MIISTLASTASQAFTLDKKIGALVLISSIQFPNFTSLFSVCSDGTSNQPTEGLADCINSVS